MTRASGVTVRPMRLAVVLPLTAIALTVAPSCASEERATARAFDTPEAAVHALIDAVKADETTALLAIFGPDAQDLVLSSDPGSARRHREVFTIAAAEEWRLIDEGSSKTLEIGREHWPFPIPLVQDAGRWRFDTAAGKEEVLDRRIGRNELAIMRISYTYVAAQRVYAKHPRDGKPAGIYAASFRSDPGRQNGLYWPADPGQPRSPLGNLMALAAPEGRPLTGDAQQPAPFRGYYFKILTAQGPAAAGGARDYLVGGSMTGGFALAAWPAEYDITGVMTFIINQDGILHQKDLGPETDPAVRQMTRYDPDSTWTAVR